MKISLLSCVLILLAITLGVTSVQPSQAEMMINIPPSSGRPPLSSDIALAPGAVITPTTWIELSHQGLDYRVRALASMDNDLYIGGGFNQTADGVVDLGHITRYNTTTDTWSTLPNQGLSAEVMALAASGTDLYAGGLFTQTIDGAVPSLGYIAHYDAVADTWQALSNQGLNNYVNTMAMVDSMVYVGGVFSQTGDGAVTNLGYIAYYDTVVDVWYTLPNDGLSNYVYALARCGGNIYAGGNFTQTGDGSVTHLGYIARYDATSDTWEALSNQGLNGSVHALAVLGSDIYVGGKFTQTGDGSVTNLGYIARYDTTTNTWYALPHHGLDNTVYELLVVGNDLYVGGSFGQTGDGLVTNLGNIARYDTAISTWHALPNQGLNSWVYTLAVVDRSMYVGGEFSQSGDSAVAGINRIACLASFDNKVYLPLVGR